jgi:hypothetical protein
MALPAAQPARNNAFEVIDREAAVAHQHSLVRSTNAEALSVNNVTRRPLGAAIAICCVR